VNVVLKTMQSAEKIFWSWPYWLCSNMCLGRSSSLVDMFIVFFLPFWNHSYCKVRWSCRRKLCFVNSFIEVFTAQVGCMSSFCNVLSLGCCVFCNILEFERIVQGCARLWARHRSKACKQALLGITWVMI